MESTIQIRYRDITKPKELWDMGKTDFEQVMRLNGRYKIAKLTSCQLESYLTVTEWISDQDKIINHLAVCDITIEVSWNKFYIMSNLPNTYEWRTLASTLGLTEKGDTVVNIVTHLLAIEARLRRARGLAPDAALFITKIGRGRHWKCNDRKGDHRKRDAMKGDDWKSQVICHGCAVKGHIKVKCRSKHKSALYEKSKSDTNLAATASTSTAEYELE